MVSHLTAQLRELDEHIKTCRTQIAHLQVEIANMESARLTLMRIEERKAYFAGQPSPFGDLNGAQIAVRDPELRLLEEGVLSRAAKTGVPIPALAEATGLQPPQGASWWQQQGNGKKQRAPRIRNELRHKVLALLKDMPKGEGMSSGDIGNFLGLPAGTANRHPLHNCINAMKSDKLIEPLPGTRIGTGLRGVYQLTERGKQKATEVSP
jgi:hypothetical protein